jgi:hypothetical protein
MIDMAKAVSEAVQREIAPLLADCDQIRADLDRTENALPILLDKRKRDAIRVDVIMRRARLECLLTELRGVEDRIVHLAKEKWPQWLT